MENTQFAAGGEFTLGAEEELLLVGSDFELCGEGSPGLIAHLGSQPRERGTISGELFGAEIEFATSVCADADGIRRDLAELRSSLARSGARALAVGLHPTAPFGRAELTRSARYDAIGANLAGLLRTPTAAFQVHVGFPDADTAISAFRGLRHHLALLRALAAGSPYWQGHDSGFTSARWAVINGYPRGGAPPAAATWDEYVARANAVAVASEAADDSYVWWDLRARPVLGTLEVRVMDAQPSLDRAAGLAALVQGLARHAVENPQTEDLSTEVLNENDFRAARYGLDARIVATDGALRPMRQLASEALADARAALTGDGLAGSLDVIDEMLNSESEYARHRRIVAADGLLELLADLARRTLG